MRALLRVTVEIEHTGIGVSKRTGYLPRKLARGVQKPSFQFRCTDEQKKIERAYEEI